MATTKGLNASSEIQRLKLKVKELESQVSDYKRRLDELRKAKNTTILKTHREVLEVNAPQLGRRGSRDDPDVHELKKQLGKKDSLVQSMEEKLKMSASDTSHSPGAFDCGHAEEIARLYETIQSLEGDNDALQMESGQLRERVNFLELELGEKEAKWCENEEKLKHKLNEQWGEKYQRWMAETEQKMEQLQSTNNMMRVYLKEHQPSEGE